MPMKIIVIIKYSLKSRGATHARNTPTIINDNYNNQASQVN